MARKTLLVDTNILLYSIDKKIDIFDLAKEEGFNSAISTAVFRELEAISKEMTKRGKNARISLKVIESKGVPKIDLGENADLGFFNAEKKKYVIATNDKSLAEKLKENGFSVVSLSKSGRIRKR